MTVCAFFCCFVLFRLRWLLLYRFAVASWKYSELQKLVTETQDLSPKLLIYLKIPIRDASLLSKMPFSRTSDALWTFSYKLWANSSSRASGSVCLKRGKLMCMVLLRHYSTVSLFTTWMEGIGSWICCPDRPGYTGNSGLNLDMVDYSQWWEQLTIFSLNCVSFVNKSNT